jgi:hypothetical protein
MMPEEQPSDLEQLQTIRANLLARLAEMTASPKPNYSLDGESYAWADLFDRYMRQLETINAQLAGQEPFEFHTRGYT